MCKAPLTGVTSCCNKAIVSGIMLHIKEGLLAAMPICIIDFFADVFIAVF